MKIPEKYRIAGEEKKEGAFKVIFEGKELLIIASNQQNWDHVSVSLPTRCPNWKEMCYVKNLFWDKEECVMQLHPPESEHINNHPYCLHLWKPHKEKIPMPPSIMVGIKL